MNPRKSRRTSHSCGTLKGITLRLSKEDSQPKGKDSPRDQSVKAKMDTGPDRTIRERKYFPEPMEYGPDNMDNKQRGKHYARGGLTFKEERPRPQMDVGEIIGQFPRSEEDPEDDEGVWIKVPRAVAHQFSQDMDPEHEEEEEPHHFSGGGSAHWIQGAISHPGALHETLGIPEGKKIPMKALKKAEHAKNPTTRKRADLAMTLRGFHKR